VATIMSAAKAGTRRLRVPGLSRTGARRLPWVSLIIVTVLLVSAVFAPWVAPHDPTNINMAESRLAPFENLSYPLGTDVMGRDMLSRLIYGARSALFMATVALSAGTILGTVLGLISGYRGGWVDGVIMRITDASLGFPTILVALILMVILGPGMEIIILAVALGVWDRYARMIRGEVLYLKEMDYVTLAKVAGVSGPVIVWRHILPNTVNVLMVLTSLRVGQVILLEASLSFLGLGLPVGSPAWGIMVSEGKDVILDMWWLSLLPGLAITAVVLCFNFFGDWLRDQLDPKMRRA
jgi:peptide/nickel transport system permease protein